MVFRNGGNSKKGRGVRICVDLKGLHDNMLREVYPIPKVDETLARSCNSVFQAGRRGLQIPLSESSKHLTAFVSAIVLTSSH